MGLFQSLWHPHFEKEKFGHRQANGKNTDVSKPRRGAWFRFSFEAVRRKQPRWHLDCGLLASRIGTIHFCGVSPSAGGPLLWQMLWGTGTGRVRRTSAAWLHLQSLLAPSIALWCPWVVRSAPYPCWQGRDRSWVQSYSDSLGQVLRSLDSLIPKRQAKTNPRSLN